MIKTTVVSLCLFLSCQKKIDVQEIFDKAKITEELVNHQPGDQDETSFSHIAFITLKKSVSEESKAAFFKAYREFANMPYIYKVSFAFPDPQQKDSYDIAWFCHFKSKADYKAYEKHPRHNKFVNAYRNLWESVEVYDLKDGKIDRTYRF